MRCAVSHLEVRGPVGGDVEDLDAGDDGEQRPEHGHPVCCLCRVQCHDFVPFTVISAQSALSAIHDLKYVAVCHLSSHVSGRRQFRCVCPCRINKQLCRVVARFSRHTDKEKDVV